MDVRLAKTAGFCFGVKRAVDTVYKQVELNSGEESTHMGRLFIMMKL